MQKFFWGSLAIVFGFLGFSAFFPAFLKLMAGLIPLMALAGGILALYSAYRKKALMSTDVAPCWDNGTSNDDHEDAAADNDRVSSGLPEETSAGEVDGKEVDGKSAGSCNRPSEEEEPAVENEEEGGAGNIPDSPEHISRQDTEDQHTTEASRFFGNTGTLVFHRLDCRFSKSKQCTAVFSTRQQANLEGYKPCGICKP